MAAIDQRVIWTPQQKQAMFISCPADDVGFGGARGGGKSDSIPGDFASHEFEYGQDAIALAIRRTRTELSELIERARQILVPVGYKWHEQDKYFRGPKGGRLRFAYLDSDADADAYQGHSYTRLYVEEMGTFPGDVPINKLQATLRSGNGVPCQMKATCNPGGPGHQHVKARYRLDTHPKGMEVFEFKYRNPFNGREIIKRRVFIPSKVNDNKYLGDDYVANLYQVGTPELVRAWLEGDWNVIAGAYFSEFRSDLHVIEPVTLPKHWMRFRAMDWGSAKPFSIGWYAVSDGELPRFPRGALIKYREWYGIAKDEQGRFKPNQGLKLTAEEVGEGIRERQPENTSYGVIDPSAFKEDGGPSIVERMSPTIWGRADNTRIARVGHPGGWDQLRSRLIGTCDRDLDTGQVFWNTGQPMIYFFSTCEHTIRTLPALQHDANNLEDIDSESEDHAADETRYACMSRPYAVGKAKPQGPPRGAKTIDEMVRRYEQQQGDTRRI